MDWIVDRVSPNKNCFKELDESIKKYNAMMDSIQILSRLNQFKNDLANEGNYDMCIRVKELIREINPMKISDFPTKVKCWDDDELIWTKDTYPLPGFQSMKIKDEYKPFRDGEYVVAKKDPMKEVFRQLDEIEKLLVKCHELRKYHQDKIKNGSI